MKKLFSILMMLAFLFTSCNNKEAQIKSHLERESGRVVENVEIGDRNDYGENSKYIKYWRFVKYSINSYILHDIIYFDEEDNPIPVDRLLYILKEEEEKDGVEIADTNKIDFNY